MKKHLRRLRSSSLFLRFLTGIGLLFCMVGSSETGQAAMFSWQTKVDDWVLQTAAEGPTEFLVFLNDQANLSQAKYLPTKHEKGAYVYKQLIAAAKRTQGPILNALQGLADQTGNQIEYQAFWIVNAIWVRGDAAALEKLARRIDVAHIYANPKVKLDQPVQSVSSAAPIAPQDIEWNIEKVRAPLVWAEGITGQGIVIGGADTGYIWDHPALKNQYRGWNGVSADHNYSWHDAIHSDTGSCGADSLVPCDPYGHGTHTMGIMVGDDGQGIQIGMAPGARWIGCRNMDHAGYGTPSSYIECYQWFIAPTDLSGGNPNPVMAPDVINNSWGCTTDEGCIDTDPNVLKSTVEAVRAAGIMTVQSAGNRGTSCSSAIYEASFTVGNTDKYDIIAPSSSRGPVTFDSSNRLKPNVSAPGQSILSSTSDGYYGYKSGTSMAAPHAAGLAALLMSAKPSLIGQVDEIETIIEKSAIPRTTSQTCGGIPGYQVPNNTYGWGRIDAWNGYESLYRKLELSNKPSSLTFDPLRPITYTLQITYTNYLSPTNHVIVSDTIPAETTFITATLPHTRDGNTIRWEVSSMSNHQSSSFHLVVQALPTAGQFIVNDAYSASSDEVAIVQGIPIYVQRAINYFFPWIQTGGPH
jgi:serine protease AprX